MKKKYLLGLASLAGLLMLASCNSSLTPITDNNLYPTNAVNGTTTSNSEEKNKLLYDPVYEATTATITTVDTKSPTTSVEETVEMVYDTVVSITSTSVSGTSSGSGVLFSYDESLGLSYIVTCFHVIEGYSNFTVTLSNDESYKAEYVGGYEDYDLAILSIEKLDLTYSSIYSDSDSLKLGSTVVAIGNPLGTLPGSVSSGVVSYVGRKVQKNSYESQVLIQTDVAINSGNSGGGLFNTAGALIGIVNAKYSATGIEGLSFAIPSNDVISTINGILATAKYDTANKVWSAGYIIGDYEYGFTLSLGYLTTGSGFNKNYTAVYYVSDVLSNETYTGTELNKSDIVSEIKVDYKDDQKTDITYTVTTNEDVNSFLYGLSLDLEDTLYFKISRNNAQMTVEVDVCQFIYSI